MLVGEIGRIHRALVASGGRRWRLQQEDNPGSACHELVNAVVYPAQHHRSPLRGPRVKDLTSGRRVGDD